ncbi:Spore germination protein gerPA/gerPF [Paenibacillus sp. 1_12]|uniref:spore germination protein n=1 Tax=Paenibacillus sp. 1_12 TaxID=1566278 RepID=UPI0008E8BDB0|nr:spore germination protein [Paenibacillus sp. 1_12]SFL12900.1 Spore germination protein gerPA/gerPF [Paenibacillus sp. 1_12]
MPSFVGRFKINNIGPSSNVQNGDGAIIILSSSAKVNAGSASFSPGDTILSPTFHTNESTNTNEPSVFDTTAGRIV